ncbi:hypothetical protein Fcan01_10324 [Folsomia candida]|uniref:Uncharacterized protein n=1 Tax=Folsomia candida TaxID=158441 RepID=A0A226E6Y3_FOLCA|nr:hypothetical protein Fcan01_10324 [Folsomia candida]
MDDLLDDSPTARADLLVYTVTSDVQDNTISISDKAWVVCKFCVANQLISFSTSWNISRSWLNQIFLNVSRITSHQIPFVKIHNFINRRHALQIIAKTLHFSKTRLWSRIKLRNYAFYAKKYEESLLNEYLLHTWILPNRSSIIRNEFTYSLVSKSISSSSKCFKFEKFRNTGVNLRTDKNLVHFGPLEYFTFLSCGSNEIKGFSWIEFVSAYQIWGWIAILNFYILPAVVICISQKFSTLKSLGKFKINLFSGAKLLLEQGDDSVERVSQLPPYFVWISFPWILFSLVLTNGYKGSNISSLTAPLGRIPFQNFSQLLHHNYSIYSKLGDDTHHSLNLLFPMHLTEIQKYMIKGKLTAPPGHGLSLERHEYVMQHIIKNVKQHKLAKIWYRNKTYDGYLQLLRKCENVALAGWLSDLTVLQGNLVRNLSRFVAEGRAGWKFTNHRISIGTEPLFWRQLGWTVYHWEDVRILRRIKTLTESGVAKEWDEMIKYFSGYKINVLKSIKVFEPQELSGNIGVIFFLAIIGCGVGMLAFVEELRRRGLLYVRFLFFMKKLSYRVLKFIKNSRKK